MQKVIPVKIDLSGRSVPKTAALSGYFQDLIKKAREKLTGNKQAPPPQSTDHVITLTQEQAAEIIAMIEGLESLAKNLENLVENMVGSAVAAGMVETVCPNLVGLK